MDFSGIVDTAFLFISAVVTGVVGYLFARGVDWIRGNTPFGPFLPEAAMREAVYEAIDFGLGAARFEAKERLGKVEIDNAFIEYTVKYVINSVPEYLEDFNITPERLTEMVKARIGNLLD